MGRYDDIINREYRGSVSHTRMSMESRAAQFAPFAALTGHGAAIDETARLTAERIELSADEQEALSERLNYALGLTDRRPMLTFTVFQADARKQGGRYVKIPAEISKYDEYSQRLKLSDGRYISIKDIISIDGDIFND